MNVSLDLISLSFYLTCQNKICFCTLTFQINMNNSNFAKPNQSVQYDKCVGFYRTLVHKCTLAIKTPFLLYSGLFRYFGAFYEITYFAFLATYFAFFHHIDITYLRLKNHIKIRALYISQLFRLRLCQF